MITELKHRIDVNTQEKLAAKTLALNEIGLCNVATTMPVAFDAYSTITTWARSSSSTAAPTRPRRRA